MSLPVLRPETRSQCPALNSSGQRECPWVGCRHHLSLTRFNDRFVAWTEDRGAPGRVAGVRGLMQPLFEDSVLESLDQLTELFGTHCSLDLCDDDKQPTYKEIGHRLGCGEVPARDAAITGLNKLAAGLRAQWILDGLNAVVDAAPEAWRSLAVALAESNSPESAVRWCWSSEEIDEIFCDDDELLARIRDSWWPDLVEPTSENLWDAMLTDGFSFGTFE